MVSPFFHSDLPQLLIFLRLMILAHPTQSVISSLSAVRDYLVIHVRDYGVVALRFIDKEWKIMSSRTFIINHVGFCGSAVADDSLFMPTSEGSSNSISVMSLEGETLRFDCLRS